MQTSLAKKHDRSKMVLTIAFTVICIVYVLPIVIVLINSFKTNAAVNTDTFALPMRTPSWAGRTISRA